MNTGILLLRVVVGLLFAGHGAQKHFGWFGGPGPRGTVGMMRSLGFRTPSLMAFAAVMAELGGGVFFALGLLTPFAALALVVVMLNAILTVHWKNGLWNSNGGFEFNLVLLTVAVAVSATGPGRFSLDRALGWDGHLSGILWGSGVLVAAAAISFLGTTLGRARPDATQLPV